MSDSKHEALIFDPNLPATFKPLASDPEEVLLAKKLANAIVRELGKNIDETPPNLWCQTYYIERAVLQTTAKLEGKSPRIGVGWLSTHWRYWRAVKAAMFRQTQDDQAYLANQANKKKGLG
jgi:hypothetical protein